MNTMRYFALVILLFGSGVRLLAQSGTQENQKTEVGTWFGMAKPGICNIPIEVCPKIVIMMPEFHGDGTMVATDQDSLTNNHLTGQGNWARRTGSPGIGATFMWLQGTPVPPSFAHLAGAFRVRLIGQLVAGNPDHMTGTIEPFFFPFVDHLGNVVLGPDGFPFPDPLGGTGELPACILPNGCLGKFEFLVRRIPTR